MKILMAVIIIVLVIAMLVALSLPNYMRDIKQVACEGPPVLVVHGVTGGYDQGITNGRGNIGEGFQIIAPSRFGYQNTPMPKDASPAAQADAHAYLLDALNISKVPVMGISAGAPSSVQFALRHPERVSSLVLLVPSLYTPEPATAQPVAFPFILASILKTG